jgi:tRNA threonylcarbamoyl adenosine modification protein YeaZ
MLSLLIESCTERGIIALFDQHKELAKVILPRGPQNAQAILPEIEKLLKNQNLNLDQLSFLTVGIGPGSYTGMRIGAMAAKTLSYTLKVPLIGISTLECFVPEGEGRFGAVIDAKIGGAYYWIGEKRDDKMEWVGEPAVAELAALREKMAEVDLLITPGMHPLRDKLESGSVKKWTWQETDPQPIPMTRSALVKFGRGEYTTDGHLTLLYLRKTQAEMERDLK